MTASPLRYRELLPAAPLREHVECFWLLEGSGDGNFAYPVLPDGAPELVLHLGDPAHAATHAGPDTQQPRAHFAGQLRAPLWLRPWGQVRVIAVRFRPAGAAALLREPQSRLAGRWIGLDEMAGAHGRDLLEVLRNAPSLETALALLARRLHTLLRHRTDPRIAAAANFLVQTAGRTRLDILSRETGLGPRQLERGFLRDVGVSPKFLARVLRFQRVFRAAERDTTAGWTRIAADCGYYDASHLIREFQALSGHTPARLLASAGELTRCFTRGGAATESPAAHPY